MTRLEDLQPKALLHGIVPDALVTVVSVAWHGDAALTLVYRDSSGRVSDQLLFRHDEERLEVVSDTVAGPRTATTDKASGRANQEQVFEESPRVFTALAAFQRRYG